MDDSPGFQPPPEQPAKVWLFEPYAETTLRWLIGCATTFNERSKMRSFASMQYYPMIGDEADPIGSGPLQVGEPSTMAAGIEFGRDKAI
jgi:hypothetical protein